SDTDRGAAFSYDDGGVRQWVGRDRRAATASRVRHTQRARVPDRGRSVHRLGDAEGEGLSSRSSADFWSARLAHLAALGHLDGIELAEANALWRSSKTTQEIQARLDQAEDDRKQAMVLFELSRLATLGTDVQSDLDGAAMMLAGALGHDAVGIWALSEHKLRLRAGTGYDTGTSEAPVDEADTVLATVLREKRAA